MSQTFSTRNAKQNSICFWFISPSSATLLSAALNLKGGKGREGEREREGRELEHEGKGREGTGAPPPHMTCLHDAATPQDWFDEM